MKRLLLVLAVLATAAWGTVTYLPPDAGGGANQAFVLTVTDTDVDTNWEIIDGNMAADGTFSNMSTDTMIAAVYATQTWFDSVQTGNSGAIAPTGVWPLSATTDEGPSANFLYKGGTPAFVPGIYGNAYSAKNGTYLYRYADSDFRLSTNEWTVNLWFNSRNKANPEKAQVLWAAYSSPVMLKFDIGVGGKPIFYATTSNGTSLDTVRLAVDYYDSTWHQATIQRRTNTAYIMIDGHDKGSVALTNANTALTVDSLQLGAFRGATSQFTGKIDNVWYIKSELDSSLIRYAYERAFSTDTAYVHIGAIRDSDSTATFDVLYTKTTRPDSTAKNFHAWDMAWLDTTETQPILIYQVDKTPRQSRIDSIPAGQRWGPVGHKLFGKNDYPVIEKVSFVNNDTTAVQVELRVYSDVARTISYTNNYYVAAKGICAKNGSNLEFDFGNATDGRGLFIGPMSYVAGYAKAAVANASITMTLQGVKKRK